MTFKFTPFVVLAATALLMPASALAQSYSGGSSYIPPSSTYTPPSSTYSPPAGGSSYVPPSSYSQAGSGMPATQTYVPAGMMLNASLQTSISTSAAKAGDLVQATLSDPIITGSGQIPSGTVLEGRVENARSGGFLGRSGELTVKFDRMRTPGGLSVPMAAHISGNIGKYKLAEGSSTVHGETAGTKVGQALMRSAIGAGAGAALGTAVGAIAGHGNPQPQLRTAILPVNGMGYGGYPGMGYGGGYPGMGYPGMGYPGYGMGSQLMPVNYYSNRSGAALGAGRGAWSGAAIGGGVGLADSLLIRKGHDVVIQSGTQIKLLLDAPIQIDRSVQYGQI